MEKWRYSSAIPTSALDREEWSASSPGHFTPGKDPRYQFYRRLDRPQSRSGCCGVEKNLFPFAGNRTAAFQPVAIPTELCITRLCFLFQNTYLFSLHRATFFDFIFFLFLSFSCANFVIGLEFNVIIIIIITTIILWLLSLFYVCH
jgi:hypothetical protein